MFAFAPRLADLLFPQFCEHCAVRCQGELLCRNCLRAAPRPGSPMCPACGLPFAGPGEDHLCSRCLRRRPAFASARACTIYRAATPSELPVVRLLKRFKYGPDVTAASTLARIVCEYGAVPESCEVIVPVPLHIRRLRSRGFNQAVLLATPLARQSGVPLDPFALARIRQTPPQVGLDDAERRRNLAGAFTARRPDAIRGREILLFDDVYTTGATVDECARTLLRAGARRVGVLTLARAVLS